MNLRDSAPGSTTEFIDQLQNAGIRLRADDGNLHVKAPSGTLTADVRNAIAGQKSALLRHLMRSPSVNPGAPPPVERVLGNGPTRASFAQESLCLFHQMQPGTSAYNVPSTLRLRGLLDVPALERGLSGMVQRHEALRTTFAWRNGEALQITNPPAPVTLVCSDLTGHPLPEREQAMLQQVNEEARKAFDLTTGPLFRPRLWKLGPEDHVLQLNMHHAVFDGWSFNVFLSELADLYDAETTGRESRLPQLPCQYRDFSEWQRRWISSDSFTPHVAFWRNYLQDAPELLDLPSDRPRPTVPSQRGGRISVPLPAGLNRRIQALQRSDGATPFAVMLTVFMVLLHRFSGQNDIVVGVPMANRTREELESLIGFLVNVVPIRIQIERTDTFRDLLHRTRDTTLEVFPHQVMPFDRLVDEINPRRTGSYAPIFQVLFAYEASAQSKTGFPGIAWERVPCAIGASKYDLTLSVSGSASDTTINAEFSLDLFETATIENWLESYTALLEAAVSRPDNPITRLDLLSQRQRQRMLVDWNDAEPALADTELLHERIEARVDESPEAVAVVASDGTITFRELDARANRLAHFLRKRGLGPDMLAGVYLRHSVDLIVSVLAILKAGGAYVPLDPDYPAERIGFMIDDAKMPVVLTHATLVDSLPRSEAQVVALDRDSRLIAAEPSDRLQNEIGTDHLAYAIYTSGSTGRPKGTLIPHRAICHFLSWLLRAHPMDASDAVLQNTQFNFDPSVAEIFSALVCGARLVLPPPGERLDAAALSEMIRAHDITTLFTVPSMLRLLLEEPLFAVCAPSLRRVSCGGEQLTGELVKLFYQKVDGALLFNCYGPTEATIISTAWNCSAADAAGVVTIGRAIGSTRVYVVDDALSPLPVGIPGELLIGGYGLARGYLNRPEMTAEKFIRDPFLSDEAARVYRTGDVVRYRADGTIEFLGRRDRQVKLRGFRIELGEIEAALSEHPQIEDAAVTLDTSSPNNARLVAYVVGTSDGAPELAALRQEVGRNLAPHMLPSALVVLDQLPLTANGKVDYGALPEPPRPDMGTAAGMLVAPRTHAEKRVAEVWREVLGVDQVGLHANFFELGGHSLLAMRAVSRLRQLFEIDVPLRDFFQAPTVQLLAAELEKSQAAARPAIPAHDSVEIEIEEGSL